ncbi:unnamed protein product [Closterium sp. NIES-53]
MALHHGAKEVVWLRRLLEEIGVGQREPTMIFCDNESAVKLAKNACLHGLTKHIRPKWHWVRRLLDKEVWLEIVKTHQQAADILTKRLAESEHWKGMKLAGMSTPSLVSNNSYLCVPPDPGIEAAALGDSESAAPGTGESSLSGSTPTEALHTFTLDSGALRSFFHNSTTLTRLSRPVAVSLAHPSGGPVLAHSSTVLSCPVAPSGLLSGLHHPSFSTNLVSGADLQDAWVDQFTPGGQRVTHCTCSRTGCHLATFTCRPGSSLYTLTTESPPVTASRQVAVSGQVSAAASRSSPASAPCSCRPLSHETLLWHHRLG